MEPISATAAAVKVAEAGINLALPPIIKKLHPLFGGDVTPDEMEYLDRLVRYKIAKLIEEAESNDLAESKPVLEDLQATALELGNLLDQYNYKQIREQVSPSFIPIKKKIPKAMLLKSSLRKGLEKLLTSVEQVDKILVPSRTRRTQPQANAITQTTSTLLSPYFGRENQCDSIIEFLLDESNAHLNVRTKNVSIIAIRGLGGSGKTFTAQHVYNESRIVNYFDLSMWVHVARGFDEERLIKETIESTEKNACPHISNLDVLQTKLKDSVSGKKFLLVLDDVWEEDTARLDMLLSPLNQVGVKGSKLIVTTRTEKAAKDLNAKLIILLDELKDEECWSILKHHAFDDNEETIEDLEELKYVGNQIISKVKHSPLALKVVGRSLCNKRSVKEWEKILKQDILKEIMDLLIFSFECLPLHLQRCFAYCSLFPKGYRFFFDDSQWRPHLISLWIAQGFIQNPGELTLEEAGKKYIEQLISLSFFEKKSEDYFVIPNLLHDLAETVSKKLCHRVEHHASLIIPKTCIHLSLCITTAVISDMEAIHNIFSSGKLRTLIILSGPSLKDIFQNGRPNLTKLRALYVHPDQLKELLSVLLNDKLKLLRYLHVQYGESLPKPLVKLYLLQIFILITNRVSSLQNYHKCLEAETLPKDFDNLTRLRTLKFYAECGNELDYLYYNSNTIDVAKLNSLQNLIAFHPEKNGPKGMMALRELSLCGSLSVLNLENLQSKVEAEKAMLNQKKSLNKLIFEWSNTSNDNLNTCADVLEGLEPQGNLKQLEIVGYHGVTFPDWMSRLPCLQTLTLRSCTSHEIVSSFPPRPRSLYINEHNELMQLSFVGEAGHSLILYDFPKSALPSMFNRRLGLRRLTIRGCSINDVDLSLLTSLEHMYLMGLPNLHTITNLSPTLAKLSIVDCPNFTSMGNLQGCTSLQRLSIFKCPMLVREGRSLVEPVVEGDITKRFPRVKYIWTDEPLLVLELVQQQAFSSIQSLCFCGLGRPFPPMLQKRFHQFSSLKRLLLEDFTTPDNL